MNRYLNKDYEVEITSPQPSPLGGEGGEESGSGQVVKTSKYIFFGNQKLATVETSPQPSPQGEGVEKEEKIIYHHEDHL
jgi:hypothetical protein